MKKIGLLFCLCLLVGCSKNNVEVDYVYDTHSKTVENVLIPIDKEKSNEILYEDEDSIDVFYEVENDSKVKFTVFNYTDYYYTGDIEFDVCEYKVSFEGVAPYSYVSKSIECPKFEKESEYTYSGQLYERNEEYAFDIAYECYFYEDDDTLFDYVLDKDEISNDDLKELAKFIYTENILSNHEGEMWVRVYPMKKYEEAYEKNTQEAWNELDSQYIAGKIWIDTENDIAEIYSGIEAELIERINYAK